MPKCLDFMERNKWPWMLVGVIVLIGFIGATVLLSQHQEGKEVCGKNCELTLQTELKRSRCDVETLARIYGKNGTNGSTFEQIHNDNLLALKNALVNMDVSRNPHDVYSKAAAFFNSCMDEEQLSKLGIQAVLDAIKDLGGWKWLSKTADLDFGKFMYHARTKLSLDIFLKWGIVDDVNKPGHKIMQMDAVNHSLIDESGRDHILLEMATGLGVDEKDATAMLKEVTQFKLVLAEAYENWSNSERVGNKEYELDQLNDLLVNKYKSPLVKNWISFWNTDMNEEDQVSGSDKILVKNLDMIVRILDIIESYSETEKGRSIINSYMVTEVLPLVFSVAGLKGSWDEGADHPSDRFMTCFFRTHEVLREPVDALFAKVHVRQADREEALNMSRYIRKSMKKFMSWMPESDRTMMEQKINGFKLVIGGKAITQKNLERLNKKYEDLNISSRYIQNEINYRQYRYKFNRKQLRQLVNSTELYGKSEVDQLVVNAYFDTKKEEIIFPPAIIQMPMIGNTMPKWFNYAGLGIAMAHELTHAVERTAMTDPSFTNETRQEFLRFKECLKIQNNMETTIEDIADVIALQVAIDALKEAMKYSTTSDIRTAILKSYDRYIQTQLTNTKAEKIGSHSVGMTKVELVLCNDEIFSEIFNCPKGCKLNPPIKCKLGQKTP